MRKLFGHAIQFVLRDSRIAQATRKVELIKSLAASLLCSKENDQYRASVLYALIRAAHDGDVAIPASVTRVAVSRAMSAMMDAGDVDAYIDFTLGVGAGDGSLSIKDIPESERDHFVIGSVLTALQDLLLTEQGLPVFTELVKAVKARCTSWPASLREETEIMYEIVTATTATSLKDLKDMETKVRNPKLRMQKAFANFNGGQALMAKLAKNEQQVAVDQGLQFDIQECC